VRRDVDWHFFGSGNGIKISQLPVGGMPRRKHHFTVIQVGNFPMDQIVNGIMDGME
jgi:hypothetical protein